MDMIDAVAAVILGNMFTLMVVFGAREIDRKGVNAPWIAYLMAILPILLVIVTMLSSGYSLPWLDAIAAQ